MVRLSQVETLTLYRGKWTTYQRSESVPQIRCVGGNAAGVFEPDVVQCYNRGSDGFDVQVGHCWLMLLSSFSIVVGM